MKVSRRTEPYFRETSGGMVLVATRVGQQPAQFPPVEYLHGNQQAEEIELGPVGRLYTYTIVHPGKDKAPYGLAMVDFEPGVRAFGRLLFGDTPPAIGGSVRVVPCSLMDGTPDYAFSGVVA